MGGGEDGPAGVLVGDDVLGEVVDDDVVDDEVELGGCSGGGLLGGEGDGWLGGEEGGAAGCEGSAAEEPLPAELPPLSPPPPRIGMSRGAAWCKLLDLRRS